MAVRDAIPGQLTSQAEELLKQRESFN